MGRCSSSTIPACRSRCSARSASRSTGAEALYADLGHFGRGPIRTAWLGFVFPALVINYFGQGALVLSDPAAIEHPLFRLVPEWGVIPFVLLATAATIIASQAVITGAFSLTRQAIQLGLLPRLEIRFTSESHQGQIFLPRVNTLLLTGVILLVLAFQSSSDLAHAYGISVFGAMAVDAILSIIVINKRWRWSLPLTLVTMLPLLFIDLAFFGANLLKLFIGGYVPVLLAIALIIADVDLAQGHPHPVREDAQDRRAARRAHRHAAEEPAASRQGHGRVPDQRSADGAGRAPAQPQAQQGAAREERRAHRADRRHAAGPRRQPGRASSRSATASGRSG